MAIKILGVDLGKHCFHTCGVDETGHIVDRKRLSRKQFLLYLSRLSPCLIGFEACGGAHYWAEKGKEFGHTVKLIPAQFVKPYVKSNKNDYLDAEAICEAVQRPTMRFVTPRNKEQRAIGLVVKHRNHLVQQRTAVMNQVHSYLLEYGIALTKGRGLMKKLCEFMSEEESDFPVLLQSVLKRLYSEYCSLNELIKDIEQELALAIKADHRGQRLLSIPGVGLITAASLLAWVGDAKHFRNGRELAAWIGLVPKQYSTGGKATLLGIGKRGHTQLRCYLIHGARSVLQWHDKKPTRWKPWTDELLCKKPKAKVVVALANKMARTLWVILSKDEEYQVLAA